MILNDLAVKYGTDKRENRHNYVAVYESLFEEFRQDAFNFLEIGVCRGASHKMWRDWFPNATIYGIDNRKYGVFGKLERLVIDQVDQGDRQQLIEYAKKGPWRAIIDDGSHKTLHQNLSFEILWDQVEPGGHYIVEDTHTSYSSYVLEKSEKNIWVNGGETLMQRMLRLTDEVCSTPYHQKAYHKYFVKNEREHLSKHQQEVEYVQFRLGLVIIKKRGGKNSR